MEFVKEDELIVFGRDQLGLEPLFILTGEGNSEFVFRHEGVSNYWDDIISSRRSNEPRAAVREEAKGMSGRRRCPNSSTAQTPLRPLYDPTFSFSKTVSAPLRPFSTGCIEDLGGGRYSHWESQALYFSTSDNSDPNVNGRIYSIRYDN